MLKTFDEVFDDYTKYGTKIKTEQYHTVGTNIIIDQGQADIAGYTDQIDGLFKDVPVIVFGDHTRIIKYINRPFFLGADGTKILKSKIPDANYKYLYYALKNAKIPNTGYNRHFKWLKQISISYPEHRKQSMIVEILDKLEDSIGNYNTILGLLDKLVKARFIEMFGNESNPFDWPIVTVDSVADVQVGVVIKPAQYYADRINGIKTFRSLNVGEMNVKDTDWVYFSEEGNRKNIKSILKEHDLLIIRSGAPGTACVIEKQYEGCNVIDLIIAHPNKKYINPYYLCMFTNSALGKRQIDEGTGGAAQQHFNVGKYKKMKIFYPPMAKQQDFECFFKQVDKSREEVKRSLEKTQQLYDSLMQEYFG